MDFGASSTDQHNAANVASVRIAILIFFSQNNGLESMVIIFNPESVATNVPTG